MPTLRVLDEAGWDGIQIWCGGCRYLVQYRFNSRWLRPEETLSTLGRRLACRRCGGRRPLLQDVRAFYVETPLGPRAPAVARAPSAADPD